MSKSRRVYKRRSQSQSQKGGKKSRKMRTRAHRSRSQKRGIAGGAVLFTL